MKSTKYILTLIIFLGLTSFYGVYMFFSTYGLRTPIILQSPIYKLDKTKTIILHPKKKVGASLPLDLGVIADKIYILESSGGKNDGCRSLGLYNGYGWHQNSFEWKCYQSQEYVREQVISWLEKHVKSGDISTALCEYNKGITENNCTYALNYNSL